VFISGQILAPRKTWISRARWHLKYLRGLLLSVETDRLHKQVQSFMYNLRIEYYRVASNRAGEAERKWRLRGDEILPCSWTTPASRSVLAPPVVTAKSIYKLTSQFYPSCHSQKIPTRKIILHNTIIHHEKILITCYHITDCYALLNIVHPHAFEAVAFEILIAQNLCVA